MNEILASCYTSLLMNFMPFIIAAVLIGLILFLPTYSAKKRRKNLENLAISSGFELKLSGSFLRFCSLSPWFFRSFHSLYFTFFTL